MRASSCCHLPSSWLGMALTVRDSLELWLLLLPLRVKQPRQRAQTPVGRPCPCCAMVRAEGSAVERAGEEREVQGVNCPFECNGHDIKRFNLRLVLLQEVRTIASEGILSIGGFILLRGLRELRVPFPFLPLLFIVSIDP